MRLVVGLGNPGREYEGTRHNAGFWFVDRLARAEGVQLRMESRFHGLIGRIGRGILEPQVEGVVFGMTPGQTSEPIETPRGYWVVKRLE